MELKLIYNYSKAVMGSEKILLQHKYVFAIKEQIKSFTVINWPLVYVSKLFRRLFTTLYSLICNFRQQSFMKTILLFFYLLIAAVSLQAQTSIRGKIVDSANRPLPAATVQLNRDTGNIRLQETLTDTAGAFSFTNVDSGKYVITISFVGYGTASHPVQA